MDVVGVTADFFKVDVVAGSDFLSDGSDRKRDVIRKERFAVFDGKDDVVVGIVGIVVSFDDGHAPILLWKPRVSKPSCMVPAASRGEIRFAYSTISEATKKAFEHSRSKAEKKVKRNLLLFLHNLLFNKLFYGLRREGLPQCDGKLELPGRKLSQLLK